MTEYRLGEVEARFADLIWQNEPVLSGELVKLAEEALDWKKSTTYTVLRRLCDGGLFRNDHGTVTSVMKKHEWEALQSEKFVDATFGGSLPKFLAAFTSRKSLTEDEIEELRRMIENAEK